MLRFFFYYKKQKNFTQYNREMCHFSWLFAVINQLCGGGTDLCTLGKYPHNVWRKINHN